MEPSEIWTKNYESSTSYEESHPCMFNLKEDFEKQEKATNFRSPGDIIILLIKKLKSYHPIGNPPISFVNRERNITINISDDFVKKGPLLSSSYEKKIEIYYPEETKLSKDKGLRKLLKIEGFRCHTT